MPKRYRRVHKLSLQVPGAGFADAKEKLISLRRLVAEAQRISEDLAQVIAGFRRVGAPDDQPFVFTDRLATNEHLLTVVFRDCDDVQWRRLTIAGRQGMLVYIDNMTDTNALETGVLEKLVGLKIETAEDLREAIKEQITSVTLQLSQDANAILQAVLTGNAVIMIDGLAEVFIVGQSKFVKRDIAETKTEGSIRGPHDAFNETLMDNIVLLRRRTRDTNLKVRLRQVGKRTNTDVAIVYIANLVKPGLVEEVERRLARITLDQVLFAMQIEEFLVDHPWTPFPQMQSTERPERVVAAIYEGRVAILMDNTPFSLIVPCTYDAIMQATDDYDIAPIVASLIRITRHFSVAVAIFLPAVYISIVSFHPGMLPVSLAMSIAELRVRTPFPSILEAVFMEGLLEIFQEAIVRLPDKLSAAAGVVGALVIGTTVVQAGLVNPLLVVVIAATALASFGMASYNLALALRFLRVPMLILGATLGLYGVMLGWVALIIHLCSLRSFGESYMGNLLDLNLIRDWKDQLIRVPAPLLRTRPIAYGPQDEQRADKPKY